MNEVKRILNFWKEVNLLNSARTLVTLVMRLCTRRV